MVLNADAKLSAQSETDGNLLEADKQNGPSPGDFDRPQSGVPATGADSEAKLSAAEKTAPGGSSRRFAVNVLAGGGANAVKIGLQLVMLPLMAHLLGPAEFGVYALALPTIAFFMTLADGGLGASLARERTGSTVIWSTAFWLVMAVGVALAILVSGWGIALARLAQEPRVLGVMALLSLSFIWLTGSVLPYARLVREGRLVVISAADIAGALTGAAVAIGLALAGAGAVSLAGQYTTNYFVRLVVLNANAFVRPTFQFRPSALKEHISTGSSLVSSRLADFAGRLAENLMYSRLFGPAALGAFTFASQVPRFVCEAASGPVWGALYAHSLRGEAERVAALHVKLVHVLALVLAPVAFLASATAPGLIHLVLGPEWRDAGPLMQILIPFYALNVIATQSGAILMAKGAGWTVFSLTAILVIARIAAVGAGLWVGPVGVAWGIAAASTINALMMFRAPAGIGQSSMASLIRGLVSPTLAGAAAGLACFLIVHTSPQDIGRIALGLAAGGACYVAALAVLEGKRLIRTVRTVVQLVRRP